MSHYHLHVPLIVKSIESHDQLVDHTLNLIATAYGGEEMGAGYEVYGDPDKDPGLGHENHDLHECAECEAYMTLHARVLEFVFEDKDQAYAAGRACDLLQGIFGSEVDECECEEEMELDLDADDATPRPRPN